MPSAKTGKKILNVSPLKNKKIRLVFPDGPIDVSSDIFTSHFLYAGKEVPNKEYYVILCEAKTDALYQYGKRLALKHTHSSYEIKEKLFEKDEKYAYAVYERLEKEGMLDEEEFIVNYFQDKLFHGYGEERIKYELLNLKRVSKQTLAEANIEDLERVSASSLVPLYEKRYAALPYKAKKEKIKMALIRRGFCENEVKEALGKLRLMDLSEESNLIKKDARKCFRLYERKYNGRELLLKVRSALMRKGYGNYAINQIMEEYENGSD